ncbi:MAG: Radical domain protein [Bryobacterales bacterium]|nr:Radical domain protein [Bryobacterales bacterium]
MSFGTAVITPRWLYVLAAATPEGFGDPVIWDETLEQIDLGKVLPGDVAGIGIHTGNALRGYALGRELRAKGVTVVFGGIHPTLYPEEAFDLGGAHAAVKGDGDVIWAQVLKDIAAGSLGRIYDGGRVAAEDFKQARWDLMPDNSYMWASVQTVRGCPKHCSFCSVWRTDGQKPRQRSTDAVVSEIVELRRKGFRFIALADDNFYPVSLTDIRLAERQKNEARVSQLRAIRAERFELMEQMSKLPKDMVFFTQITMEAAEDSAFLNAMRNANIKGALVGVEAVTPEGLKDVFKDFNASGDELIKRLQTFKEHGVHVLGSFIFGLPSDRENTFAATCDLAEKAGVTFAQFVMLTPFAGTVDFEHWEKSFKGAPPKVNDIPLTRYWLIPQDQRPKMFMPHPTMGSDEMRARTQAVWDRFYNLANIWKRSGCVKSVKSRLAFVLISKLYRQMYASTGIATDSARKARANNWARMLLKPCRRLFQAKPMPELEIPDGEQRAAALAARQSERLLRVLG